MSIYSGGRPRKGIGPSLTMNRSTGYLSLLLLAILWGTMVPSISHLLLRWDPFFVAAFRYVGAVPVMWLAVWLSEWRRPPMTPPANPRRARLLVWPLGMIGIGLFSTLYTVGIQHCNPITAAILTATSPAVAAIVNMAAFGQRLDPRMLPAIALAILGGAMATVHFDSGDWFDFRGGEVLIIGAFAAWSWYSAGAQRWCQGWSQLRITAAVTSTGSVALVIVYVLAVASGMASFPPPPPEGVRDFLLLLWVTVVLVGLGVALWNFGVGRAGVVVASLYLNLVPVVAIGIFAWFGTVPGWSQVSGGILVLAGIVMSEMRILRSERALDARGDLDQNQANRQEADT